ncbi:MAG: DJ-1/PfpI family protein, partial [Mycobacteriaceae bacterium]|nr:DJ-1/PfpI family protein [Mycobacteriaceae bacterium]
MAAELNGKRVAFLVAPEGAEQAELTEPWKAVEAAGGQPELISTEVGKVQAFNHLTPADTFEAEKSADSTTASDYAGLVLPGGVANPDFLRTNPAAVRFVKSFFDEGKP